MDPPVVTTAAASIPTALSASSPSSARGSQQPQSKPLSCTSCRARKLKCDRQHPCRNCVRSGLADCVFPERKRSRRPRKTKNSELLQRLHRLESIVGKVGLQNFGDEGLLPHQVEEDVPAAQSYTAASELLDNLARGAEGEATTMQKNQHSLANEAAPSFPGQASEAQPPGAQPQTRPQDSTASRYLSGDFWATLCEEVGGLRQALEQSLDSDAEEDDGSPEEGATPESTGTAKSPSSASPATLLLGPSPAAALSAAHVPLRHPTPEHIRFLTATYFQNVDMLLKILHRPTVTADLHAFADLLERNVHQQQPHQHLLSPEREALFFAIYYAAVTSLPTEKCAAYLGGHSRQELAQTYRAGIEHALARADYLNSSSLEPLQALTLYTGCLRSHDGSRASWALLSLPIRLAQALDLHREGEGEGEGEGDINNDGSGRVRGRQRFTPFEAEQRRRLWWQLIVLDVRAAEDRGTRAIVARDSYDTRLPHNVDDADFGPETTEPLSRIEKRRATARGSATPPSDVTFSLCTAESSAIFLYFEHAQGNVVDGRVVAAGDGGTARGGNSRNSSSSSEQETVVRLARHLETRFVHGADPAHAASYLASVTVRLIILKLWLAMRYPLHRPRGGGGGPSACSSVPKPTPAFHHAHARAQPSSTSTAAAVSRESTLRTAVTIVELSERGRDGPFGENFKWWSDMYVQWHPLAVALAELCTLHQQQPFQNQTQPQNHQQEDRLIDEAWSVIDDVFPRWSEVIADTKRGTLWRPIRALYKKARQAKEAAAAAKATEERERGKESVRITTGSEGLQQQQKQQQQRGEQVKTEELAPPRLDDLDIDMDMGTGAREVNMEPPVSGSRTGGGYGGADMGNANVPPDLGNLSLYIPTNGMSQEWLAWPDVSFDLPPSDTANWGNMDWSTWDQFVLDTYADRESKSGSSEPS